MLGMELGMEQLISPFRSAARRIMPFPHEPSTRAGGDVEVATNPECVAEPECGHECAANHVLESAADRECAICLSDIQGRRVTTPCGHSFCEHCLSAFALQRLLVRPSSDVPCPLCRACIGPETFPDGLLLMVPRPRDEASEAPRTQSTPALFGIKLAQCQVRGHIRVATVKPGSPAGSAGVCIGMLVLSVNGTRAVGLEQTTALLRDAGSKFELRIGWDRAARGTDEASLEWDESCSSYCCFVYKFWTW